MRLSYFHIVILLTFCEAYKILVFNPRFGKSHVRFVGSIADLIAEAGHNVTVLLPIMNPSVMTNGSKLAKTIILPPHPEVLKFFGDPSFSENSWQQKTGTLWGLTKLSGRMADAFTVACEHVLSHTDLLNQLRDQKFDLAVAELFDACPLGLIELLQIPSHIFVSPGIWEYTASVLGVPNIPSYVPNTFAWFTDKMTYFQRAANLFLLMFSKRIFIYENVARGQALFRRKFGDDFIDLEEKIAQASFFLTNAEPYFDYPQPATHKVISVAGFSVPKVAPLNEYWSKVMTLRDKVILVSFGSVIHSYLMPLEMKTALLKTFDQFSDITFIWKYEKDEDNIADGHPNVVTSTWLPQNDLLAHPNLIVFVTHGGMNSLTETLRHGKPVVVVPVFGGQLRNGILAERAGIGKMLRIPEITTPGKLKNTLTELINDDNYTVKAQLLAKMIAGRPNPPKEQLVKYVEFAAEFGHLPNMDSYGRKMPFYSYFMLDILIPALLACLLAVSLFAYLLYLVVKRCFSPSKKVKRE